MKNSARDFFLGRRLARERNLKRSVCRKQRYIFCQTFQQTVPKTLKITAKVVQKMERLLLIRYVTPREPVDLLLTNLIDCSLRLEKLSLTYLLN